MTNGRPGAAPRAAEYEPDLQSAFQFADGAFAQKHTPQPDGSLPEELLREHRYFAVGGGAHRVQRGDEQRLRECFAFEQTAGDPDALVDGTAALTVLAEPGVLRT